jgi:hypothetical protein
LAHYRLENFRLRTTIKYFKVVGKMKAGKESKGNSFNLTRKKRRAQKYAGEVYNCN